MISKEEWLANLDPEDEAELNKRLKWTMVILGILFVAGVIFSGIMWGFPVQL